MRPFVRFILVQLQVAKEIYVMFQFTSSGVILSAEQTFEFDWENHSFLQVPLVSQLAWVVLSTRVELSQ
jgi:hypothetical protein